MFFDGIVDPDREKHHKITHKVTQQYTVNAKKDSQNKGTDDRIRHSRQHNDELHTFGFLNSLQIGDA